MARCVAIAVTRTHTVHRENRTESTCEAYATVAVDWRRTIGLRPTNYLASVVDVFSLAVIVLVRQYIKIGYHSVLPQERMRTAGSLVQPVPPAESRSATFRDLEEKGVLDELREAHVIYVQDVATKQMHMVFGRNLLTELVATGEKREGLLAYAVELDA